MKSDSELTAKFSNIFINVLYGIMIKDMNKVRHFLSDEVYNKYKNIVDTLESNEETQLYDELNVGKIDIINREIKDDKEIIQVSILAKYMDYVVDSEGDYKRGNNEYRIEKEYLLTFEHLVNAEIKNYYRCESCGNNLDINFTGECPYCKNIVDVRDTEYILTSIEERGN